MNFLLLYSIYGYLLNIRNAEKKLLAVGCPKLNLQVRTGNQSAIAFYERLGYKNDEVVSMGKRLIEDSP
jgi:GNAT superfamily N-acetyltransferase